MAPPPVEMYDPAQGKPDRAASVPFMDLSATGQKETRDGFGGKSITWWGSFCLNLNNCMGPAMVLLPLVNQQAGWFTPTVALSAGWFLSSFAATMLCDAMQRIPGNGNFEKRYEFATTVRHFYGQRAYVLFQIFYNLSMQASNVAAMIISAQVVDNFITRTAGHSYALDFEHWNFVESTGLESAPWCNPHDLHGRQCAYELKWVLSVGYLLCMAICIPFGWLNLDENMWFQWLSFGGLLLFTFEFWGQFIVNFGGYDHSYTHNATTPNASFTAEPFGLAPGDRFGPVEQFGYAEAHHNVSKNGFVRTPFFVPSLEGQSQVVGVAAFAYAYVVTIPSWVNEKKPDVSINSAVWWPATCGLWMKLASGLLGAWAYQLVKDPYSDTPDFSARADPDATDILQLLMQRDQPSVTQYSAYLWDILTLIPGIPVLAIMIRYNLLSGNVCGPFWSFFWGVVFPWIVTAFCYEQDALTVICTWIGLLVQGYINFVVPALIYITALERYPDDDGGGIQNQSTISNIYEDEVLEPLVRCTERKVNAVPKTIIICGRRIRVNRKKFAMFIAGFFTLLSTTAIITGIISAATGDQ